MRNFDVKIRDYGLSQYWSSLQKSGNTITGQLGGDFSGIVFGSDVVEKNRNIVSDAPSSISLRDEGVVSGPVFRDFGVSMVLYPEQVDVNLVTFEESVTSSGYVDEYGDNYDTVAVEKFGIKLNSNSTISLLWPVNGILEEQILVFQETVSYLALTKVQGTITMQLNNDIVSIEGDDIELDDLSFGSVGGATLIDKVAFNITGALPRPFEYYQLFRMQKLDNVPRPDGQATFLYLNEAGSPKVNTITRDNFSFENDYFYSALQNDTEDGVWSITKLAEFTVDYSLDQGATWQVLPVNLSLNDVYQSILFRHNTDPQRDYSITVVTSQPSEYPMAFFDLEIDGILHLPWTIGQGYYDVVTSDMTAATIKINAQDYPIRTVEFLGELNESGAVWLDTSGAEVYVNGQLSSLDNLQPKQIYHIVVVYPAEQTTVTFNSGKDVSSFISGIGASAQAYTASDAFYLYNVFAGNTFVAALETIDQVADGISQNASTEGEPVAAVAVQWNS